MLLFKTSLSFLWLLGYDRILCSWWVRWLLDLSMLSFNWRVLRILLLFFQILNLPGVALSEFEISLPSPLFNILASGKFVSRGLLDMLVSSGERLWLLHLLHLCSPILQKEYEHYIQRILLTLVPWVSVVLMALSIFTAFFKIYIPLDIIIIIWLFFSFAIESFITGIK